MYPESYYCELPGHLAVMRAAMMEPGVHTMSDELILQISCNVFLAFKWILMMTSRQNISYYTTAKLSIHVWNHDLIWWQNKIDTQKHFHKTTITSSWTLSKTKIPITIVNAQMPSNPNLKSRTRDNDWIHIIPTKHSQAGEVCVSSRCMAVQCRSTLMVTHLHLLHKRCFRLHVEPP